MATGTAALNAGNTAIGVAAANVASLNDVTGEEAPLVVALGFIPNCTAIAAGATVTAQIVRNDTGAVIGSGTLTNSGAGVAAQGPLEVVAVVPRGTGIAAGISLQVLGSAAAGNAVGTAAAPCVLAVLGFETMG
jgi:cytochrome c biogenesis protein CcdA